MVQLLQMWALVEVLGLICLPLTMTVFHNLPDRGWAFSKAIGIALLAFCVWLPLMYLHTLPFSQVFIAGICMGAVLHRKIYTRQYFIYCSNRSGIFGNGVFAGLDSLPRSRYYRL